MSLSQFRKADFQKMSLLSSSQLLSPLQANSSFISIEINIPQACTSTEKFVARSRQFKRPTNPPTPDLSILEPANNLFDKDASIRADKIAKIAAIYTR